LDNIYLSDINNIFSLKKEIANLHERINYLNSEMVSVGGFSTDERVQKSPTFDNNRINYAIDEKKLLQERIEEKQLLIGKYQTKLVKHLDNLDDDKLKDALRYRFLHLAEFSKIADLMQYSEGQVRRFVSKGLSRLNDN